MLSGFLQRSSSLRFIGKLSLRYESSRIKLFPNGTLYCRDEKNKKIKRNFWSWSKKEDNEKDKLNIKRPKCDPTEDPILDSECKVAIVVGGTADIGLSAADALLYNGARAVVLADEDSQAGEKAAQNLCDFYGKNRAQFHRCSLKNSCQLEGIFEETICKYKAVNILFNNLDRNNTKIGPSVNCEDIHNRNAQSSNTMKLIHTGMEYMAKNNRGTGGIIINSASIIGFMGWPNDPTPVYCFKEPVAETSIDLAKKYPLETTGVRIVALLKSQRPLDQIGLPDFPISNSKIEIDISSYCEPSAESRIGKALIHVMARAKTGTTWLSEPAPCLREIPWLIHFPLNEGEIVDSRIYENQKYTALETPCHTPPTGQCPSNCDKTPKCKKFWKTRKRSFNN